MIGCARRPTEVLPKARGLTARMPSDPVSRDRWRAAQNSSVADRLTAVERGPKPFQDPVPHAFAQRVGSMSRETPNVKTYRPFTPQKRPANSSQPGVKIA